MFLLEILCGLTLIYVRPSVWWLCGGASRFFALIKAASANAVLFLPLHMTEEQISPRAHGPQITVSLAPVLLLLVRLAS